MRGEIHSLGQTLVQGQAGGGGEVEPGSQEDVTYRKGKLARCFRIYDADQSGKVKKTDLLRLGKMRRELGQMPGQWSEAQNERLIQQIDRNRDGFIDESEYTTYYHEALPVDRIVFDEIIVAFLECGMELRRRAEKDGYKLAVKAEVEALMLDMNKALYDEVFTVVHDAIHSSKPRSQVKTGVRLAPLLVRALASRSPGARSMPLDATMLQHLLHDIGVTALSKDRCAEALERFDHRGDGCVPLGELADLLEAMLEKEMAGQGGREVLIKLRAELDHVKGLVQELPPLELPPDPSLEIPAQVNPLGIIVIITIYGRMCYN